MSTPTGMLQVLIMYLKLEPCLTLRIQQTILVADGGEDYRKSCDESGEPLITSMSPETDPHPFDLEVSLVKSLVGPPRNRTAWEVCS